jgi:hypothetical protein
VSAVDHADVRDARSATGVAGAAAVLTQFGDRAGRGARSRPGVTCDNERSQDLCFGAQARGPAEE